MQQLTKVQAGLYRTSEGNYEVRRDAVKHWRVWFESSPDNWVPASPEYATMSDAVDYLTTNGVIA